MKNEPQTEPGSINAKSPREVLLVWENAYNERDPFAPIELYAEDAEILQVAFGDEPLRGRDVSPYATALGNSFHLIKTMNKNVCVSLLALTFFLLFLEPVSAQIKQEIKSVKIGKQIWMAENLSLTTFRNGDNIAEIPDAKKWEISGSDKIPAFSYYANDLKNKRKYGLLYNYFALTDSRGLCPSGWRVPNNLDWNELEKFLGKDSAASKLKSSTGWANKGGGTNESGFNALPGGFRRQKGDFFLEPRVGYWWSIAEDQKGSVTSILLFDYDAKIFRIQYPKELGQSVRCIKE